MSSKITPMADTKRPLSTLQGKPSCSELWDMPELFEATFEKIRETLDCTMFEIQSTQGLKYILHSRKLPSHITEMSMIHRTFMEEVEILKLCNDEEFFVPKLVNIVISEDASFWNGSTFFIDTLFLLPEPEHDYIK